MFSIRPLLAVLLAPLASAQSGYTFGSAQTFLKTYCAKCHEGKAAVGGFNLARVAAQTSLKDEARRWLSAAGRVAASEMPPKNAPAPDLAAREQFTQWVDRSVRAEACAAGVQPGPAVTRRLNRDEYAATVRDLLDIHMDLGAALPADGAGGEGFDNAAETLFLSPLHSEKYMDAARFAMDFAAKEYKSRTKILIARPGPGKSADKAAEEILRAFLPRAFRRPVDGAVLASYLDLFRAASKQGQPFESAIFFTLRGALVSPMFLFKTEAPNSNPESRPLDQYALAARLSYFLWGSTPDEFLFDIAADGKLHDPEVLRRVIPRMLRHDRSIEFASRFTGQWLGTRALAGDKAPDAKLFPTYSTDEELRGDIRFQPILFFREIFVRDLPLLELIDSKFTIATSNLEKHWNNKMPLNANARKQPQWVALPEGSNNGGLLGMPAVLAVSSHPYRTSPVLRGAWIMDAMLGTPPPPPPPDVPALEEPKAGAPAKSIRERLSQHRANPVCASCHARIDPLGFALERFDVIGRWRDQDGGAPVDDSAELSDGTKIQGPAQLKAALLERKDLFIRNLTAKMLGYALGRGLTLEDSCTVDQIAARLKESGYSSRRLIEEIVLSAPFRMQSGTAARVTAMPRSHNKEQAKKK